MAFNRNSTIRATLNTATAYVTDGLVLRLDGAVNVADTAGSVTSWTEDGGGLVFEPLAGNPATSTSPGGAASVNFEGVGLREMAVTGLPTGSASRTLMICWATAEGAGQFGGFGWGAESNDQSFKILANPSDEIAIDTFGVGNALVLGSAGDGWRINTATYDGTTVKGYNGVTQAGGDWAKALNTGTTQTDIMLSFSGNATSGEVGAVFVYNRVLSASEIAQNVTYLNNRFITDIAAPSITAFALSNPSSVTLNWAFESDEGGTFDLVVTTSATTPNNTQIEAGQDHTGAAAAYSALDQNLSAGTNSGLATGLSASETYYGHLLARDNVPNAAASQTSAGVATLAPDVTAPIFSVTNTTPGVGGVTVEWTTDEANGTGYLYVSANAVENAATVKTGTAKAVSTTGAQVITVSGLTADEAYYHHLLHEDAAGNSNAVVSTAFTTASGAATSLGFYSDAITLTFGTSYTTGRYWNGEDAYVVRPPGGVVTITATTPTALGNNAAPANFGDNRVRHGTMLNYNLGGGGNAQAFDSHEPSGWGTSIVMPYSSSRQADPALTGSPIVVSAEGSIIKSISIVDGDISIWPGRPPVMLTDAGVLTIVDSAPPANAFRPSPHIASKAHRWTTADVDLTLVPSNLTVAASAPSYAAALAKVERMHMMGHTVGFQNRQIRPTNHQREYGADIGRDTAYALLLAMTNAVTTEQRERLIYGIVQIGIDVYDRYTVGGQWLPDGGVNVAEKVALVTAATLLDDAGIKAVADNNDLHEDAQIWVLTGSDIGRGVEPYIASDVGDPEWGNKHATFPVQDSRAESVQYRDINTRSQIPSALACQMITGARAVWNYQPYFDYADRVMERNFFDSGETLGGGRFPSGGTIYNGNYVGDNPIGPFAQNMWALYRASYGNAIWNR